MKRTFKKVLAAVLTLTMTFSSLVILQPVNAENEVSEYTIYPTPHEVVSVSYTHLDVYKRQV